MEKVNQNRKDYIEYEEVLSKNSVSIDTLQYLIAGVWCEIFTGIEPDDRQIADIRRNYKSAQTKMYIINDVLEAMQARNASVLE